MGKYKYLEGTSHIDPDNGILYKVLRVEEKNHRGQGTFIVAFRAQELKNGKLSTKCDREGIHVRDIEKYIEGEFRDVVHLQIDYSIQSHCPISRQAWEYCRCLRCLPRHTAKLPDPAKLDKDEFCCVSCSDVNMFGSRIDEPVWRRGVTSREDRAEFIVCGKSREDKRYLARNPRVYVRRSASLEYSSYYAEFEDCVDKKIRYVIGENCRYQGYLIKECPCEICKKLVLSASEEVVSV